MPLHLFPSAINTAPVSLSVAARAHVDPAPASLPFLL